VLWNGVYQAKFMACPSLEWRTATEVLTGETPDASEYLNFDFYGWVSG
jgi:hypothetical protein